MQVAARHAAACLGQRCPGLLQLPALPALTLQAATLTSVASLGSSNNASSGWHSAAARGGSGSSSGSSSSSALHSSSASSPGLLRTSNSSGLILPLDYQQQQQVLRQLGPQQRQRQQQQWVQRRPIFNFAGFGGDLSKSHHEKKLLGWSPRQVYDVVAAVEHYHRFVPWCQRSTVLLRRPPGYLEAELEVGFQMFVERYTSKVTLQCPTAVHSRVDDSTLFSYLTNKWEFRLGPTPHTTWLTFEVEFAFKSPLYRQVASIFFEEVVQRMMGAFEGRCGLLYGPSSLQRRPGHPQQAAAGGR